MAGDAKESDLRANDERVSRLPGRATLPRSAWPAFFRAGVVLALSLLYVTARFAFGPDIPAAEALSLVPIVGAGLLFGLWGGGLAVLLAVVANAVLGTVIRAEPLVDSTTFLAGSVLLLVGLVTGRLSDLEERLRVALRYEREAAEAMRLAEARGLYEATAVHLVDGLALVDADQRVQFWNPALEMIVGIPSEHALGRPLLEVEAPILAQTADAEAARGSELDAIRAVLGGTSSRIELHLLGSSPRDLVVLYFPVPGPDRRQWFGTLVRDVTRERELGRIKDEMVSVVSHELRTPLAALVGFAELLLTREWPEAQRRQFLETMLQEGQRLSILLNDFLDVRRLEHAGVALAPRSTDLAALITLAAALLRNDATQRHRLLPSGPPHWAVPVRHA